MQPAQHSLQHLNLRTVYGEVSMQEITQLRTRCVLKLQQTGQLVEVLSDKAENDFLQMNEGVGFCNVQDINTVLQIQVMFQISGAGLHQWLDL
jgi:hypothetical protein